MSDPGLGAEGGVERRERAALVRALNGEIRDASERFPGEEDVPLEFYCECGCWQTVEITIAGYDALEGRPVLLPGHQAVTGGSPRSG